MVSVLFPTVKVYLFNCLPGGPFQDRPEPEVRADAHGSEVRPVRVPLPVHRLPPQ